MPVQEPFHREASKGTGHTGGGGSWCHKMSLVFHGSMARGWHKV